MQKYNKPVIEVLAFDEEEILTESGYGYDAAKAVTAMMGDDADYTNSSTSITTVKVTSLGLIDD